MSFKLQVAFACIYTLDEFYSFFFSYFAGIRCHFDMLELCES